MSFDIAANAALSPNRYVVALKGSADRIDFRFRQPAVIRRDAQGFLLEPATLVLPQGSVRLAGRLGDRTALQSRFERSEEHTSELQSLMRISYAVFCLKKKKKKTMYKK